MSSVVMPPLTDEHIAAHEAGHALVAHLMGDRIEVAYMYKGEQSASVKPVDWPPSRATILGGLAAELLLGFTIYPQRAETDRAHAASLPNDPGDPSPRGMLIAHQGALNALRQWFTEARQARLTIPGVDIHAFLETQGCVFGSLDAGPR
jgi:hypothetical protein